MTDNQNFNAAQTAKFSKSLIDTLNKSALSFMISIGHRSNCLTQ
jgi:mitochondrial fission protein ELM1